MYLVKKITMNVYFMLVSLLLHIDISEQCALPYWWTQQYHLQPTFLLVEQPKTSIRFRERYHHSNPNNYFHIQEYSEYTWWENGISNTKRSGLTPQDIRGMSNVVFTRGGPVNNIRPVTNLGVIPRAGDARVTFTRGRKTDGMMPIGRKMEGMIPRGRKTVGMIPRGRKTEEIIPRADDDTNGMFPSFPRVWETDRKIPRTGDTNGMIPRGSETDTTTPKAEDTNGMFPRGQETDGVSTGGDDTNGMTTGGYDTNGMSPGGDDTNGMFPRDENTNILTNRDGDTNGIAGDTNGMIPRGETNGINPPDSMKPDDDFNDRNMTLPDRERNEDEVEDVESKVEDLEENDLETSDSSKATSELKIKEPKSTFFGTWFGKRNGDANGPCKVPETDIHSLRSMIEKMFSSPREHILNPESKEKARGDIMNKFRNFGLQVWTQNFTTPPIKHPNGTEEYNEGVNLIGVIPGLQRGSLEDEIVLVGAHYDTVQDTNGVDDNGSGLAVMLEVARAITEARCRLNNSLMFVAFDHEENGAMGSNYFVDHYLIPEELKRARARFQGAFILDGIMNYNSVPNTQELPPDYAQSLPGFLDFVNSTGNRGNFLAMISRNEMDSHLSRKLMDAWKELGDPQYKLFNLAVDMGNTIPEPSIIEKHVNFLTSDHATFWYHNSSSHFPDSLNAVLLTDTGPYRGQMKECYHSKCDDLTVITPEKLQFAKKTADALTATLVELTSATAAGNQIHPSWFMYAVHIMILYYVTKALRNM